MSLKGKLLIETVLRQGQTVLKNSFCTQPFKLANVTEEKKGQPLRLIVMSSSPGILDGDEYEIDIAIGEGCQLSLETQSYQRLFQMKEGASQTMKITMGNGSSLCYLPQ